MSHFYIKIQLKTKGTFFMDSRKKALVITAVIAVLIVAAGIFYVTQSRYDTAGEITGGISTASDSETTTAGTTQDSETTTKYATAYEETTAKATTVTTAAQATEATTQAPVTTEKPAATVTVTTAAPKPETKITTTAPQGNKPNYKPGNVQFITDGDIVYGDPNDTGVVSGLH